MQHSIKAKNIIILITGSTAFLNRDCYSAAEFYHRVTFKVIQ